MIILRQFIIEASLVAQMVKHLPTMRETRVQYLGLEDLLEKEQWVVCAQSLAMN